MKNLLTLAALITAIATPVSFVLEAHGISVPSLLNSSILFGAFGVIVTALTVAADYRAATWVRCEPAARKIAPVSQTALPLAA